MQQADVIKLEEVEALASAAIVVSCRIDVWINHAGLIPRSTYNKKKVAKWDQMIKMINVIGKGVLYGMAAGLP
nr:hypothetical protein [Carnobacterium gallinarum]